MEIIVVLVIIAILAAIAIPAMVGWIDKANERANYAEARTALLAAQTLASENYSATTSGDAIKADKISELAQIKGTTKDATVVGGKVTSLTYTGGNGKSITYSSSNDKWE